MKLLLTIGGCLAVQGLLSLAKFNQAACKDSELAGKVLSQLAPDFSKCFGANSLFFASPFTACGKCREPAIRTSMLFQSRCKLPPAPAGVQFGADKNQVFVNWANKTNVDAVCHTESVYEKGEFQYKYNCLQALMNADTAISNAKAKAEVRREALKFGYKDMDTICNNCTKILVSRFRGIGNAIPFTYSFIPSTPPDELLGEIAGVCGYSA